VSYDVYFQRFLDGSAVPGGGDEMRRVLAPHVTQEDPASSYTLVELGDGSADVYLSDDSMMANHIHGRDPWQLLVDGARAAGWVIMPVDGPTCLIDESQRAHLPDDLTDRVVLVGDGNDLLRVLRP
jgi:hypothetical protein